MENEIIDVVNRYIQLVHTQDRELFHELFMEDSSLISITKVYQGSEAVYNDFLIGGIRKAYSVIDLINDGLEVSVVNDELAIAVFRYRTECIRRENGEAYGIKGLETQVIVKDQGKWKIRHIHYSK